MERPGWSNLQVRTGWEQPVVEGNEQRGVVPFDSQILVAAVVPERDAPNAARNRWWSSDVDMNRADEPCR
jgi:hypothetical protein